MSPSTAASSPRRGRGLVPALAFYVIGFVSFAGCCAWLWLEPGWLLNEPTADSPWIPFATLLGLGWLGSVVFGTAYHVVPMLAGTPWWNRRLPWVHLVLHGIGLAWCMAAAFEVPYMNGLPGATAIVAGIGLFAFNQQLTASRVALWEPGSVTFTLAVFWLAVTALVAVFVHTGQAEHVSRASRTELIGLVAHLGVLGFGLMALIGAALKLVPMFLVSSARPAGLAWLGCFALSAGLHALAAGEIGKFAALRTPATWLIGAGATAYLGELVRLIWCGRRALGWDLAAAALGLLFLLPLCAGLLTVVPRGLEPSGALHPSLVDGGLVLALVGPCTMIAFGLAARLLPLLAWQIRFADRVGWGPVPEIAQLSRRSALPPMTLALGLGCGYLAAALVLQEKTGVVFAAAALLAAAGLLSAAVWPGLRAVLHRLPSVSEKPAHNALARTPAPV